MTNPTDTKPKPKPRRGRGGIKNRERLGLDPIPFQMPFQNAPWVPIEEFNFAGLLGSIKGQSKAEAYQAYYGYFYNHVPVTGCQNFRATPETFKAAVARRTAELTTTFFEDCLNLPADQTALMVDIIDAIPHMCGVDIERTRQSNGLMIDIIDENPHLVGRKRDHTMMYPWPIIYFGYPAGPGVEAIPGVLQQMNDMLGTLGEDWKMTFARTTFADAPAKRGSWQKALIRCPQKRPNEKTPDLLYRSSYRIDPADHGLLEIWFRKVENAVIV